MLILNISSQNKFVTTLGTVGKSAGPGDLMYLKVVSLVSNGHSLEYGVPLVASLRMHSDVSGVQFAYLFIAESIGPWGFCSTSIAKLLTSGWIWALMQCCSLFLNHSNHLDSLASVNLGFYKMMLDSIIDLCYLFRHGRWHGRYWLSPLLVMAMLFLCSPRSTQVLSAFVEMSVRCVLPAHEHFTLSAKKAHAFYRMGQK